MKRSICCQDGKKDTATCIVKLGLTVANINGEWMFFQVSVFKPELKCLRKKKAVLA